MSENSKKLRLKFSIWFFIALILFGCGFITAASIHTVKYHPNMIVEFGARYNTAIAYLETDGTILVSTYDCFTQKSTAQLIDPTTGKIIKSIPTIP